MPQMIGQQDKELYSSQDRYLPIHPMRSRAGQVLPHVHLQILTCTVTYLNNERLHLTLGFVLIVTMGGGHVVASLSYF